MEGFAKPPCGVLKAGRAADGSAAIANENGIVVEGRDGMSGKVMDAENPVRSASTKTIGASAFGSEMTIPAGGFAIVVQQTSTNLTYTGSRTDGRYFLYSDVIAKYGNCVQISVIDSLILTEYKNSAPTITANSGVSVVVNQTSEEEAKAQVIASIAYSDDNGTFDSSDDVTSGLEVVVTDTGSYDASTAGTYGFTVEITDANGAVTQITASVTVTNAMFTIDFTYPRTGATKTYTVDESTVCVVDNTTSCPTSNTEYSFVIFTPEYTGSLSSGLAADQKGVAVILNRYGEIRMIYDGLSQYKYSSNTFSERVLDGTLWNGYTTASFNEWKPSDGEYLIIATGRSNDGSNSGATSFLLSMRWSALEGTNNVDTYVNIGMAVNLTGTLKKIEFDTKES